MKQQLIIKYTKNLLLFGRSVQFYWNMLSLISNELPAFQSLSKRTQQTFLNSMGLAISHLHVDLAADAIELVFTCNPEYLKSVKQMLKESKGDCKKIAIINSLLFVQNVHNISSILRLQWHTANMKQQEAIASHIATFVQRNSAFREKPTDFWQSIITSIHDAKASNCSKTAKRHLSEAETFIREQTKHMEV